MQSNKKQFHITQRLHWLEQNDIYDHTFIYENKF